ncbi:MAG: ABC transporter ATP-binding protein, partial [Clostridiales bacterium]|nr:ABC transporter ATP-binding protein [Clostridiales bacterium]
MTRQGKKRLPSVRISGRTALRLFRFISGKHKPLFICVLIFIIISSVANVASAGFIKTLLDDYIAPLLLSDQPDFTGLLGAIGVMAAIYAAGVAATLFYNRFMVTISQDVLKRIRDDMFSHMQYLPAKYFDANAYGDIMSRYTNDTDTLRQLISMSIPQAFASLIMIISVIFAMLALNLPMTLLVFACVAVMLFATKTIGGRSAGHFIKQQHALGNVNGFIEEMINGQKVVKVFNHEKAVCREFDDKNDELFGHAAEANRYANILMPIMGNIGNMQYVLIALIGGAMAIFNVGGVTIGAIAAFLSLSRSFAQPIGQISMQVNAVIMALAGAERIFNLLDEPREADEGYVTLVNAKRENGIIVECTEHTGLWAWKHPHQDGTLSYTEVRGDVQLLGVDFAYEENKPVLRDITIYAKPGQKIAFVGATGAGKTTITNLINRFYDIADGKVRFDNININKIRKNDLR